LALLPPDWIPIVRVWSSVTFSTRQLWQLASAMVCGAELKAEFAPAIFRSRIVRLFETPGSFVTAA